MNIVLVEPEIPQNTGNIVRTCNATSSVLHLIKPFGFEITDKHLKRAGLDYWYNTEIHYYENVSEFFEIHKNDEFYFASTKGAKNYCDVKYGKNSFILFGKETKGLPETLLKENYDRCVRIPMVGETRSLNLANSVAIVLYEALRQNNFENFKLSGKLTSY